MSAIVVFVEQSGGAPRRASLEALGAAAASGQPVTAVVTGPGAADCAAGLGAFGANKAVALIGAERYSPDGTAEDMAELVKAAGAKACLAAATSTGKDLMPRVAARLDCTLLTDCTAIELGGSDHQATRPILAGKAIVTLKSKAPIFCATLRPSTFPVAKRAVQAQVSDKPATVGKVVVTSVAAKVAGKLDVKEAPTVVAGGRGLKEPENFKLLEDLAAALGNTAVGASRAVVDAGWRPHSEQVGQTGKTVSPQLYFAVGISGAIQHLAGMRTSKVIVAINKDPAAPIFKVADYGIVGDAMEVLPALTEAVKKVRASQQ
jgi:electron transfer flavoprotein alpha subunit